MGHSSIVSLDKKKTPFNSFVAPGWKEERAWERGLLSVMPRFPALAWLRFTPSKNVYVFLICLFYPDDTSKDIYTTHHFDNFHLSFDPKLVHEGLQVFLHLNTVVFELCFQLSQEKLRFKYD